MSFQIRIRAPNRWPNPTKLGVLCKVCVVKCPPKCTAEAPELHWAPFWSPRTAGVRVGGVQPHQITFGMVPYNFDFTNSTSVCVTMAPEGHGALYPRGWGTGPKTPKTIDRSGILSILILSIRKPNVHWLKKLGQSSFCQYAKAMRSTCNLVNLVLTL